jgi:hypothetical protein
MEHTEGRGSSNNHGMGAKEHWDQVLSREYQRPECTVTMHRDRCNYQVIRVRLLFLKRTLDDCLEDPETLKIWSRKVEGENSRSECWTRKSCRAKEHRIA